MTHRLRLQWETLGAIDPYWAVLTHPGKKGGRWDKDQFFATGATEMAEVEDKLARLGMTPRRSVALDYGCGVGRLSRALAARYEQVISVDISEAMLREARTANAAFPNIRFVRGSGLDVLSIAPASVDFIYSNLVLQHSPREVQRNLIREFCRVLAPGGVLVFQNPSRPNVNTTAGKLHFLLGNRLLNIARRIVYGKASIMELHSLPKREVLRLLTSAPVTVVEAERYDSAGPGFVSFRYFCRRDS